METDEEGFSTIVNGGRDKRRTSMDSKRLSDSWGIGSYDRQSPHGVDAPNASRGGNLLGRNDAGEDSGGGHCGGGEARLVGVTPGNSHECEGGLHFGGRKSSFRWLESAKGSSFRGALCGTARFGFLASALIFTGCAHLPKVSLPGVSAQGPANNGTPATVGKSDSGVSVALPAGSRLVKREIKGLGYRPATNDAPAQAATPDETITEIIPGGATEYHETKQSVNASSGTIDTSVANHKIDVEERRWLLWAAIGCGIAGLVVKSMLPAWPSLSNGLLIASPCAFAAWKFAEVPAWLWGAVIVVVLLLVAGYKRAEWDKDHDGIPDFLQKSKPPTT